VAGPTNFRNALLPAIDTIRGIPNLFGMRLYGASVLVRTWLGVAPGARPGMPGATSFYDTVTAVKLAQGAAPMTVRQVTQQEVIASGGLFQDLDMRLGPITPPYTGSYADNDQISVLDPPVVPGTAQEIFYLLTGPDLGANGAYFKLIKLDVSKPFSYFAVVRKAGLILTHTPFLPTSITGCQFWVRADRGITIGTGVSGWADQSGVGDGNRNLSQATASAQPTLNPVDAAYNFNPTVSFASAAVQTLGSSATGWSTPLSAPATVFVVGQTDASGAQQFLLSGIPALYGILNIAGVTYLEGSLASISDTTVSSVPTVFVGTLNGASSSLRMSAITPAAIGNTGTTSLSQLYLGSLYSAAGFLNGKISDVAIYNKTLAADELTALMTYAGARYNVAIGP